MIRRSASSASFDELDDDGRISWNIFAQIRNYGFNAQPGSSTWIVIDDSQCLALIERSL
jgi:hypothetical protein